MYKYISTRSKQTSYWKVQDPNRIGYGQKTTIYNIILRKNSPEIIQKYVNQVRQATKTKLAFQPAGTTKALILKRAKLYRLQTLQFIAENS